MNKDIKKVCFNNGKLRILMMSDFQESIDSGEKTFCYSDKLVEKENPDIVVLGGDQINHNTVKTYKETEEYLSVLVKPMEKRNIPWIHVLGNHDHDTGLSDEELARLYEKFPNCLSSHVDGIHGVSNYCLNIYGSDGKDIIFNLWGLDSQSCLRGNRFFDNLKPYPFDIEKRAPQMADFGFVYFDQLMWYYNLSRKLEEERGKIIPSIMFVHLPPWEAQVAMDAPQNVVSDGKTDEGLALSFINTGLFSAVLQRGDVKCIASGHAHNDTFTAEYCSVKIVLDGSAGFNAYGDASRKGGRIFEIDESNPKRINTHMTFYKDI